MNTKNIDNNLISANILALYANGEFSTTENLKDDWVMLIDIGRHLNTIMSNPNTTPDAIKRFGLYWERYAYPTWEGDYLIVDEDWVVHHGVKATEEDFDSVNEGYGGLINMAGRIYYHNGELKNL